MSIVKGLFVLVCLILFFIKLILLLKDINKQRDYFINVLSHDLRVSTLAQIRALELLQKDSGIDKNMLLSEIENSCKFSLEMITTLLNTYKYENSETVLNYKEVFIWDILKKSYNKLDDIIRDKNILIYNKIDFYDSIKADEEALSKLVVFLLLTILNVANENSKITINVRKNLSKVNVTFIYNGKFLTKEEYNRMFSKDTRFSTVGHGIRMNLCKKIVDFHGGDIYSKQIESNVNSFTFEIPIKPKRSPFVVPLKRVLTAI